MPNQCSEHDAAARGEVLVAHGNAVAYAFANAPRPWLSLPSLASPLRNLCRVAPSGTRDGLQSNSATLYYGNRQDEVIKSRRCTVDMPSLSRPCFLTPLVPPSRASPGLCPSCASPSLSPSPLLLLLLRMLGCALVTVDAHVPPDLFHQLLVPLVPQRQQLQLRQLPLLLRQKKSKKYVSVRYHHRAELSPAVRRMLPRPNRRSLAPLRAPARSVSTEHRTTQRQRQAGLLTCGLTLGFGTFLANSIACARGTVSARVSSGRFWEDEPLTLA